MDVKFSESAKSIIFEDSCHYYCRVLASHDQRETKKSSIAGSDGCSLRDKVTYIPFGSEENIAPMETP